MDSDVDQGEGTDRTLGRQGGGVRPTPQYPGTPVWQNNTPLGNTHIPPKSTPLFNKGGPSTQ
jgi:hypothetical protein